MSAEQQPSGAAASSSPPPHLPLPPLSPQASSSPRPTVSLASLQHNLNQPYPPIPLSPPGVPALSPKSRKNTVAEKEGRGINVTYRRAIIKAMESLHDYQSRSNIDMIRRHTQDLLFEQQAVDRHCHPWNDALFLQTLKSIVRKGDIDLFTKSTAELTPSFKRQRADSLVHRLEEKITAAAVAAATTHPSLPNPHHVHHHHHPDHHHHHHHQQQQQQRAQQHQQCDSPAKKATRKSEHDKWKIVPKKVYDHSTIVNPMDTH